MTKGSSRLTIFVDATLTLGWNRPPIGLVRVEMELLRRFLSNGEIKFVQFVPGKTGPREVDGSKISEKLNQLQFSGRDLSDAKTATITGKLETLRLATQSLPRIRRLVLMTMLFVGNLIVQVPFSFLRHLRAVAGNALVSAKIETREFRSQTLRNAKNTRFLQRLYLSNENSAADCKTTNCHWSVLGKNDVLFSVGNTWDYLNVAEVFNEKVRHGFRYVAMCYDLVPIKVPQYTLDNFKEKFELHYADLLWSADHIFSISESSKKDLVEFMNHNQIDSQSGMSVVNLGSMMGTQINGDSIPKWIRKDGFVLYVSTIERRKNHETVFNAFAELCKESPDTFPYLVFVGMPGWHTKDFIRSMNLDPRVRDSSGRQKVKVLNDVNDEALNWLYANALFTVYPSFYEGWGLPVAESLSNGTPVITSTGSSFSEVGAGLTIQVDPYDTAAWKSEIKNLLQNPEQLKSLRERTKEYRQHSWDTAFQHVITKLKEVSTTSSGREI